MPIISMMRTDVVEKTIDETIDDEASDDEEDEDDADYVPGEHRPKRKKRLKKKRKRKEPDLTELSLPKAAQRLEPDIDLSGAALHGCLTDEHKLAAVGPLRLPKGAPPAAAVELVVGRRPTRGTSEHPGVSQYRLFYGIQLPGMPFYNDAYHLLLTLDAQGDVVSGGATFRFVDLMLGDGGTRVLILDVLALAVNPGSQRGGAGSACVSTLKTIASKEAASLGARPLLLTQADLSCVGFWAKNGFARALDATALVRSLRRASGHTIFSHATPMALALPRPTPRPASARRAASPRRSSLGPKKPAKPPAERPVLGSNVRAS